MPKHIDDLYILILKRKAKIKNCIIYSKFGAKFKYFNLKQKNLLQKYGKKE